MFRVKESQKTLAAPYFITKGAKTMAAILSNLRNAVLTGFVLAAALLVLYIVWSGWGGEVAISGLFRWAHVISGIMWIGLLYYFNFVQMIAMPGIPDEQKPAISKHIAPRALFWFRWAALSTVVTGLVVLHLRGDLVGVLTLGLTEPAMVFSQTLIGIGVWLGLIMAFNVWFIIWPNQKKALGIVDATPDEKKAAARLAMLISRTNMVLSIPMLFAMVGANHLP